MGWQNENFALLIVVSGAGFSGAFVYSGTPGANNLIASVSANSGTDPYGNSYLTGVAGYSGLLSGNYYAASFFAGGLDFWHQAGPNMSGAWSRDSVFTDAVGTVTGATNGVYTSEPIYTASSLVAVTSAIAAETWHAASLQPGFSSTGGSFAAAGYQFEAIGGSPGGGPGRVRLRGQITLTAAEAGGTTIFTLPAGYVPADGSQYVTPNDLAGAVAGTPSLNITSGGAVQIAVNGALGNTVGLDGVVIELD